MKRITPLMVRAVPAALLLIGFLLVRPAVVLGQGEPVPASAVIDGKPRGIFLGRSLLTGRAVCLLFLSGGRVTRAIPNGGLEHFDWAAHKAAHSGDVGTWEIRGGQLSIAWGDGGVHQGPLTVTAGGIEFHGKRYSRPVAVTLADLAGQWEAARGTAITGGEGINTTTTLSIQPDGRYRWTGVTGGAVAGRATAGGGTRTGRLSVSGQTMTFRDDDGTVSARTLIPVAGTPVAAMSLDADLFTRIN
jgi:hypothetical protein